MTKDQVWKITSFVHTNRPKKLFQDLFRLENDQNFPCFFKLRRNSVLTF